MFSYKRTLTESKNLSCSNFFLYLWNQIFQVGTRFFLLSISKGWMLSLLRIKRDALRAEKDCVELKGNLLLLGRPYRSTLIFFSYLLHPCTKKLIKVKNSYTEGAFFTSLSRLVTPLRDRLSHFINHFHCFLGRKSFEKCL